MNAIDLFGRKRTYTESDFRYADCLLKNLSQSKLVEELNELDRLYRSNKDHGRHGLFSAALEKDYWRYRSMVLEYIMRKKEEHGVTD